MTTEPLMARSPATSSLAAGVTVPIPTDPPGETKSSWLSGKSIPSSGAEEAIKHGPPA
jgi:hypothetical protein